MKSLVLNYFFLADEGRGTREVVFVGVAVVYLEADGVGTVTVRVCVR